VYYTVHYTVYSTVYSTVSVLRLFCIGSVLYLFCLGSVSVPYLFCCILPIQPSYSLACRIANFGRMTNGCCSVPFAQVQNHIHTSTSTRHHMHATTRIHRCLCPALNPALSRRARRNQFAIHSSGAGRRKQV
jgi:hypothetical protein